MKMYITSVLLLSYALLVRGFPHHDVVHSHEGHEQGPQRCVNPAEWMAAFNDALNGEGTFKCASWDLMGHLTQVSVNAPDPNTLNPDRDLWDWAAGKPSLDVFMKIALEIKGNRRLMIEFIMSYVGWQGSVSDDSKYIFVVFSRSKMAKSSPFEPFQPTWNNLYKYFDSFEVCIYNGFMDNCQYQRWSVQFNRNVQYALANEDVSQVTGCFTEFDGPGCSRQFEDMSSALTQAKNDPTRHPSGALAAAREYMNYVGPDGMHVPMLDMSAAQARAFFYVVLGASWLFTGDGRSNNGYMDTEPEWIVRGDSPYELIGARTLRLL